MSFYSRFFPEFSFKLSLKALPTATQRRTASGRKSVFAVVNRSNNNRRPPFTMTNVRPELLILTGTSHPALAESIGDLLRVDVLSNAEVGENSAKETQVAIHKSLRGKPVYIIQTGTKKVNTDLMETLILSYAAKTSCASQIVLVMPYMPYSRQCKMRKRGSVVSRLLADMLLKAGVTQIVTIDLHAKEIVGFFSCPINNLRASTLLIHYIKRSVPNYSGGVVVARNPNLVSRAHSYAERLKISLAVVQQEEVVMENGLPGILSIYQVPETPGVLLFDEDDRLPCAKLSERNLVHQHRRIPTFRQSSSEDMIPENEREDGRSSPMPGNSDIRTSSSDEEEGVEPDLSQLITPVKRDKPKKNILLNGPPVPKKSNGINGGPRAKMNGNGLDEKSNGTSFVPHIAPIAIPIPTGFAPLVAAPLIHSSSEVNNVAPSIVHPEPIVHAFSMPADPSAAQASMELETTKISQTGVAVTSHHHHPLGVSQPPTPSHSSSSSSPDFATKSRVLVGDVRNKTVFLIDDILDECDGVVDCAKLVKKHGAIKVIVVATHGLFSARAAEILNLAPIDQIIVTNSVPPDPDVIKICKKIAIVDIGPLLAEAVRRLHFNESLSFLFKHITPDGD